MGEAAGLERLDQERVEAGGERALLVLGAGVAGDRGEHDRRAGRASRATAATRLKPSIPAGRCRTGRSAAGRRRLVERFLGAARGADLVAPELHLQAQALERVGVVLDDQDAVALAQRAAPPRRRGAAPAPRRAAAARGRTRCPCRAFAEGLDVAAVQLRDAPRQRQADAEAAERARPGVWSCCANSSKACGRKSGAMPWPRSLTEMCDGPGGAAHARSRSTPGSKLNLAALPIRLRERLRQPRRRRRGRTGARPGRRPRAGAGRR